MSYYSEARRITFDRFRRWYTGAGLEEGIPVLTDKDAKKIPAEYAWSIIRTFIKGYKQDGILTPERYADIPRKDHNIDQADYERVYRSIWQNWYKKICDKGIYWDDQDLVRRTLNEQYKFPIKAVIVCDECQDFTRIELRLILRLSLLRRYTIPESTEAIESSNIPIFFAGDPLQSINPSGFQWKVLRAHLYEELQASAQNPRRVFQPSFESLTLNYRSQREIVKFLNLIQLRRKELFDIKELDPQNIWKPSTGAIPSLFTLGENIHGEELQGMLNDTSILIPADEGGDLEFVRSDPLLNEELKLERGLYRNVHTALSAKGLEFDRVILYKFGESFRFLPGKTSESPWDITTLAYFYNKLYVAASRARRLLLILDTAEGYEALWQPLQQFYQDKIAADSVLPDEVWRDKIGVLESGDRTLIREFQEDHPKDIAESLEREGHQSRDSILLLKASAYFVRLGSSRKARECEAYAKWYSKEYAAAGAIFLELKEAAIASDVFWEGLAWSELYDLCETDPSLAAGQHKQRLFILGFMRLVGDPQNHASDPSYHGPSTRVISARDILQLGEEVQKFVAARFSPEGRSAQWSQLIFRLTNLLSHSDPFFFSKSDRAKLARTLEQLDNKVWPGAGSLAARLYYQAGDFRTAIDRWKSIPEVNHPDFFRANAQIEEGLASMQWWDKAQEADPVLALFRQTSQPGDEAKELAVRAFERKKLWRDAFSLGRQLNSLGRLFDYLRNHAEVWSDSEIRTRLEQVFRSSLEQPEWNLAIDIAASPSVKTHESLPLQFRLWLVAALLVHRPRKLPEMQQERINSAFEETCFDLNPSKPSPESKQTPEKMPATPPFPSLLRFFRPLEAGALIEMATRAYAAALAFYSEHIQKPLTRTADIVEQIELRRRWLYCNRELLSDRNILTHPVREIAKFTTELQQLISINMIAPENIQTPSESKKSEKSENVKSSRESGTAVDSPKPRLYEINLGKDQKPILVKENAWLKGLQSYYDRQFGEKGQTTSNPSSPAPRIVDFVDPALGGSAVPAEIVASRLRMVDFFDPALVNHRPPVKWSLGRVFRLKLPTSIDTTVISNKAPPNALDDSRNPSDRAKSMETLPNQRTFQSASPGPEESPRSQESLRSQESPDASPLEPEIPFEEASGDEPEIRDVVQSHPEPEKSFEESELAGAEFIQIDELRVRNFRAFREAVLKLDRLSVLLGKNGAGKTTLRLALDVLRESMSLSMEDVLQRQNGISQLLHRSTESPADDMSLALCFNFRLKNQKIQALYGYSVRRFGAGTESGPDGFEVAEEVLKFSHSLPGFHRRGSAIETSIKSFHPSIDSASLLLPLSGGVYPLWEKSVGVLRELRSYMIEPGSVRNLATIGAGRHLGSNGENAANVLKYLENQPDYSWISDHLKRVVPEISRVFTRSQGKQRTLIFDQQRSPENVSASTEFSSQNMSDGTLRVLGILLALRQLPPPSLIMIEEVENSVHPYALSSLIDAMLDVANSRQVLITSHSPELLCHENIGESHVRFVQSNRGMAEIFHLSPPPPNYLGPPFLVGEYLRHHSLPLENQAQVVRGPFFALGEPDA